LQKLNVLFGIFFAFLLTLKRPLLLKNHNRSFRLCSVFLCLFVFSEAGFAQLKADFTSSVASGCTPLVVQFKDASSGSPTGYSWSFGTGVTSTLQNPGAVYNAPGTYTVTLTVKNGAGADSIKKVNYVTVYAKPTVDFDATPPAGCSPLPVQFTDKTNPGSGNVKQWTWDFGDGQVSNEQSPKHVYTTVDTFTVSLRATNSFGCTNIVQKQNLVNVNGVINVDFTYTYSNACAPPTKVNFSSTDNTPGLSYQWLFGDGGTSPQKNPVYTYNKNGQYNVQFIVTTDQGCRDTIAKDISIGTVLANFILPPAGCVGKKVNFTDSSTPTPVFAKWRFGDGQTSSSINAAHTYAAAGSYNVQFVANFGSCTDSITKVFTVTDKPKPSFTSTGNRATCNVPSTIQFQNTTSGAVSYQWDFGDGNKSTVQNPSHTYTVAGYHDVTLVAFNSNGCSDTLKMPRYVQLGPPSIDSLLHAPFQGCIPAPVNFEAAISSGDPVTSYKWDFGAGNTSTAATPTNTYNNVGSYNVTLTVNTASGCSKTAVFNNVVRVGDKPNAQFTADPTDACSSKGIQFTDKSSGNITGWRWSFGDTTGESLDRNPIHFYKDTGYFSVRLLVESNGCKDSVQIEKYIHINPPVSNFTYSYHCGQNRLTRDFTNTSIGAVGYQWDFGDGQTSTDKDPSHTFPASGTYYVKLTTTNGGCTGEKIDSITVLDLAPSFKIDPNQTSLCRNDSITFKATNYDSATIAAFYWDFGDGNNSGFGRFNSATHKYTRAGNFTPFLITRDVLGCKDTVKKAGIQLHIFGARANFANANGSCVNAPVTFSDLSTPDGTHPIISWTWNYGDGTIETSTAPPFQHVYSVPGIYPVTLTVQDSYGCIDSLTRNRADTITKPKAYFSLLDSIRCTQSDVSFIDSSQGIGLTYAWNFGDNKTSTEGAPTHSYVNQGIYTVSLAIMDKFGCKDTATRVKYVKISDVRADFAQKDTEAFCPPLRILPRNNSHNYTFLTWDFGDGNTSNLANPDHSYTIPGKYTLLLIAQGHGSCYDTAKQIITLHGPTGTFTYDSTPFCAPGSVLFNATGHNVVGYQWIFGDGTVNATSKPSIKYEYKTPGMYLPNLIIIDSAGCQVSLENTGDSIRVAGVSAKFSATTPVTGCDSALVIISDSSSISFDSAVSYHWSYGEGTPADFFNMGHYYYNPGTYTITQTIKTALGCTETFSQPVTINIHRSPRINTIIPTSICINTAADFRATNTVTPQGSLTWLWQFGNGDTAQTNDTTYTYTVANTYTASVTVTNEFGCADTVQATITVQPLPLVDAGLDSIICLGQSVTLQPTGAATYVWASNTTLSCTNCENPVAKPDTTTRYYVTGTSAAGCVAQDSILLEVKKPFTVSLQGNDTLCIGSSIQLSASGAEAYNWQPSTGLDDANIANPMARPTSTTTYTVTGSDLRQCFTSSASVVVNVYPNPTVNIVDTSVTIMTGDNYLPVSTNSPDVVKWQWLPPVGLSCSDCATPTASPRQTTTYQEKVFTQYGCTASDSVTVVVLCNEKSLFIPNTFSPNGDGMNDYFYPRGAGLYNIKSMRIFNRLGQVVFERVNFSANDPTAAWDGKVKGKLQPSDVYLYVVETVCVNGTILASKGNVTLLR